MKLYVIDTCSKKNIYTTTYKQTLDYSNTRETKNSRFTRIHK